MAVAAPALAPSLGALGSTMAAGGLSSVANYAVYNTYMGNEVTLSGTVSSFVTGAVVAGLFYGAEKLIGKGVSWVKNKVAENSSKNSLYHYTNEKGMQGIVQSKELKPSLKANNPKDARYGDGQYFSDIIPGQKTPAQLSKEFINVPNKYKYTHYVEVNVKGLNPINGRPGVYVVPNNNALDISNRIVSYGKIPTR